MSDFTATELDPVGGPSARRGSTGRAAPAAPAVVAAFATLATLVTFASGPTVLAAELGEPIVLADGRQQYRESVWGFRHRRRAQPGAETARASAASSIERVSLAVHAGRSVRVPSGADGATEISRPDDVSRTLAAMGPGAASRLASADSGMRLVLQIGSFVSIDNALGLRARLADHFPGVYTSRFEHAGRTFHRVRIARFADESDLARVERSLVWNGFSPLRVLTSERTDPASPRR